MGPNRSLRGLVNKYSETLQNAAPTQSINTLWQWSADYKWVERAAAFDAEWEARKNTERQAEMEYGLALDFERVRKLKRLADFLEAQIFERSAPDPITEVQSFHNIWVPDVKVVGKGDSAEIVDIERFNTGLLQQYRETLNDLAKEVGGRVAKTDVTSGGQPLTFALNFGEHGDQDD